MYATSEYQVAENYAKSLAGEINGQHNQSVVRPIVYEIIFQPGVEIALDEDVFGWALFVKLWRPQNLNADDDVRYYLEQSGALDAFEEQRGQALQEDFDILKEIEKELEAMGAGPEEVLGEAILEDPDFFWYRELVDTWSNEFAEPVLEGWLKVPGTPPNLRILNANFDLIEDDIMIEDEVD